MTPIKGEASRKAYGNYTQSECKTEGGHYLINKLERKVQNVI